MKNKIKIGLSVVAGLVSTAATAYLFKSKQGQQVKQNMSASLKKVLKNGEQYSSQLSKVTQEIKQKLNKIAKEKMPQRETKVKTIPQNETLPA